MIRWRVFVLYSKFTGEFFNNLSCKFSSMIRLYNFWASMSANYFFKYEFCNCCCFFVRYCFCFRPFCKVVYCSYYISILLLGKFTRSNKIYYDMIKRLSNFDGMKNCWLPVYWQIGQDFTKSFILVPIPFHQYRIAIRW